LMSKTKNWLSRWTALLLYGNPKCRWRSGRHLRGWMCSNHATTSLVIYSRWSAINSRWMTRYWRRRSCSGSWRAALRGWNFLILLLRARWNPRQIRHSTAPLWGGYGLEITCRSSPMRSPKLATSSWAVKSLNARWERQTPMESSLKFAHF